MEDDKTLKSDNQNQDMQHLVYGLSHDMGAPLRAIVQFSQLLARKLDGQLDEKERYWLELICNNGLHAQAMIASLVQYSRIVSLPVEHNVFVIDSVIQTVLIKLSHKINQLEATINYTPSLLEIEGDIEQWKQVFTELLENSLLFRVADKNVKTIININIQIEHKRLIIIVEDNGIGIDEAKWHEITRPFKRLNRLDEYVGVGMGLSICERILDLHGWSLRFNTSTLGGLAVICSQNTSE